MKLHDQAQDDIKAVTAEDWPDLNVKDFQAAKSIEDKVDSAHIKNLMIVAAGEVIKNFDETLVVLPLEEPELTLFRYAVYEQTYAWLLGDLPVHRQHDSDTTDIKSLETKIEFYRDKSLDYQRQITGFKQSHSNSKFSSELL